MIATSTLFTLGSGTLALFVLVMAFWDEGKSGSFSKRLDRVSGEAKPLGDQEKGAASLSLRKQTADSGIPILDRLIKAALPNPERLRARLAKTGRSIGVGEYLTLNAILVLIFFLIFAFMIKWSHLASFFMGIALGLYLPHKITGRMGNRRIMKFLGMFPESIDTICRALRSGLPITEAIATVGQEMPDPVGVEFRRVSDSVRMGRSLEESMWEVASRLDTPEYRFFIIALAIQRETGGNLAETLGNLSDLLRKRRQLKLKIRAMSSEARASAMIIGSLPFVMFTLLMAVNSEYMMILLNDMRGKILVGGGLTWISMGVFVMKGMINFDI